MTSPLTLLVEPREMWSRCGACILLRATAATTNSFGQNTPSCWRWSVVFSCHSPRLPMCRHGCCIVEGSLAHCLSRWLATVMTCNVVFCSHPCEQKRLVGQKVHSGLPWSRGTPSPPRPRRAQLQLLVLMAWRCCPRTRICGDERATTRTVSFLAQGSSVATCPPRATWRSQPTHGPLRHGLGAFRRFGSMWGGQTRVCSPI